VIHVYLFFIYNLHFGLLLFSHEHTLFKISIYLYTERLSNLVKVIQLVSDRAVCRKQTS
jgi:hypothetical protein